MDKLERAKRETLIAFVFIFIVLLSTAIYMYGLYEQNGPRRLDTIYKVMINGRIRVERRPTHFGVEDFYKDVTYNWDGERKEFNVRFGDITFTLKEEELTKENIAKLKAIGMDVAKKGSTWYVKNIDKNSKADTEN